MKISIFVPDKTLKVIDDFCEREGYKRSNFLVMAALRIIGKDTLLENFEVKKKDESPSWTKHIMTEPGYTSPPVGYTSPTITTEDPLHTSGVSFEMPQSFGVHKK